MFNNDIFDEKMIADFITSLGFDPIVVKGGHHGPHGCHRMPSDIYEEDDKIVVEIDVPSCSTKEDIKIEYENENLLVRIEKERKADEEKKYIIRERRISFKAERVFHIDNVDEENISAELRDGVLTITLKKLAEKNDKKTIEIK